jgi:hypothetical protein
LKWKKEKKFLKRKGWGAGGGDGVFGEQRAPPPSFSSSYNVLVDALFFLLFCLFLPRCTVRWKWLVMIPPRFYPIANPEDS